MRYKNNHHTTDLSIKQDEAETVDFPLQIKNSIFSTPKSTIIRKRRKQKRTASFTKLKKRKPKKLLKKRPKTISKSRLYC